MGSLFRPYIKLDLQGADLYPRDTCTLCANEISSLMNALRAMYGLRRVTLPVTSLLLSASTIHLLNLPAEPSASHLSQALHDLQAMSTNHQFAAQCVDIIRSLAKKWSISLPEGAASVSAFRLAGQRPSPTSSNFWAASIPRDVSSSGTNSNQSSSSQHESPFQPPHPQRPPSYPNFFDEPGSQMDPGMTQNLFWTPFPGQTMPVPPEHVVPSMHMDMSGMENSATQWPTSFEQTIPGLTSFSQTSAGPLSSSVTMTNNLGYENWQWN